MQLSSFAYSNKTSQADNDEAFLTVVIIVIKACLRSQRQLAYSKWTVAIDYGHSTLEMALLPS